MVFGTVELSKVYYASDEGVTFLNKQGLKGLKWKKAKFDDPKKVEKELFQLSSGITMPKCLTRIRDHKWDDVTEKPLAESYDRIWDNGGYYPLELSYKRAEVEAMGEFDVALTQEVVGGAPELFHQDIVVSQKFRQILLGMKNVSCGFTPVHLL